MCAIDEQPVLAMAASKTRIRWHACIINWPDKMWFLRMQSFVEFPSVPATWIRVGAHAAMRSAEHACMMHTNCSHANLSDNCFYNNCIFGAGRSAGLDMQSARTRAFAACPNEKRLPLLCGHNDNCAHAANLCVCVCVWRSTSGPCTWPNGEQRETTMTAYSIINM